MTRPNIKKKRKQRLVMYIDGRNRITCIYTFNRFLQSVFSLITWNIPTWNGKGILNPTLSLKPEVILQNQQLSKMFSFLAVRVYDTGYNIIGHFQKWLSWALSSFLISDVARTSRNMFTEPLPLVLYIFISNTKNKGLFLVGTHRETSQTLPLVLYIFIS